MPSRPGLATALQSRHVRAQAIQSHARLHECMHITLRYPRTHTHASVLQAIIHRHPTARALRHVSPTLAYTPGAFTHMQRCRRTRTHTHTHTHARMHTCTHAHMHTCTHTCTHTRMYMPTHAHAPGSPAAGRRGARPPGLLLARRLRTRSARGVASARLHQDARAGEVPGENLRRRGGAAGHGAVRRCSTPPTQPAAAAPKPQRRIARFHRHSPWRIRAAPSAMGRKATSARAVGDSARSRRIAPGASAHAERPRPDASQSGACTTRHGSASSGVETATAPAASAVPLLERLQTSGSASGDCAGNQGSLDR
eukprot:359258-Chlamydomonas_euryale.AAC.23